MSGVCPLIRSERDLAQYINLDITAPQRAYPGERIEVSVGLSLDEDVSDRGSLGMILRTEERKNWKGHIDVMLACNIGTLKDFTFNEDVFEFTDALLTHHHFKFSDAYELFKEDGVYQFKFEFVTPYKSGSIDYDIIGVRARIRDKHSYEASTWDNSTEKFIDIYRKMQPVGSVVEPGVNVCELRQRA